MKSYKTIISLMSGTSMDGIDACLIKIYDDLKFKVLNSYSINYPDDIRKRLLNLANNIGSVKEVCELNFTVGDLFSECVNSLIEKAKINKSDIDFISTHGQTICHLPDKHSTLQIGDISVISEKTGITTIGDFRPKDMAANGQGAPLVPFADKILFGTDKNRLIQNIGGISNVTVLSRDCEIFAFDNGAGNMLIDYFMQKLFGIPYDKNGEIALKGEIDNNWLKEMLQDPYYKVSPPKSTGREHFNKAYAEKLYITAPSDKYDIIATITALTAKTIADSYINFVLPKTNIDEVVLGGGGAYNKAIIKFLRSYLQNVPIKTHEDFGIPNKLKECIAFAYLGYFTFNRKPNNLPSCTGAKHPVIMGKISY